MEKLGYVLRFPAEEPLVFIHELLLKPPLQMDRQTSRTLRLAVEAYRAGILDDPGSVDNIYSLVRVLPDAEDNEIVKHLSRISLKTAAFVGIRQIYFDEETPQML